MVKLACMTLPYRNESLERALEGISRAGYRYVSLGLPHEGIEVPEEDDSTALGRLVTLCERYGLEPVCLVGTNQLAPGQPIERARRRFEAAKVLGVKEILSLGTWGYHQFPDSPLPEEELTRTNNRFVTRFREIAEWAERYGITVTLKPHTGNTATEVHLKQTLEAIGSDFVQACYDPGNVHYYEGIRSEEDMPIIIERLYSFIAKDHRGARANADFPVPGEGDVRFTDLFRQMKEAGFTGSVQVERADGAHPGPWSPVELDEQIRKARTSLESMLKEAGWSEVL